MVSKKKKLSGQALHGTHRVNRMDPNGQGIVEIDGHSVRVAGTYSGDTVRLHLVHRGKHGNHHARLTDLVEPSPSRVESPCPHFLDCGGCDLLHVHPDEQLRWKREVVASALGLEVDQVEAVRHAEYHFDYRALAKFVVGPRGMLGSFRRRSNEVTCMDECVVHAPAIAAAHELVQARLQGDAPAGIRYVVMRASIAEERVIVTLVCTNPRAGIFRQFAHDLGKATFVAAVDFHHNDSQGNAIFGNGPVERLYDDGKDLVETIGSLSLQLKSNAFSQINPSVAELLYRELCQLLGEHATNEPILDLYAGSGGIGLSYLLRDRNAAVIAVESSAEAVKAARQTAAAHGLENRYTAVHAEVLAYLQTAPTGIQSVVVNPPRKGLGAEVIRALAQRAPQHLLYVSCNPKSLAKDALALSEHAYRAIRIVPFDLFPNTAQVETLAVFEHASA